MASALLPTEIFYGLLQSHHAWMVYALSLITTPLFFSFPQLFFPAPRQAERLQPPCSFFSHTNEVNVTTASRWKY